MNLNKLIAQLTKLQQNMGFDNAEKTKIKINNTDTIKSIKLTKTNITINTKPPKPSKTSTKPCNCSAHVAFA